MKEIKCNSCGQSLKALGDYHTHESCLLFKLNDYRKYLGKPPIEVDIEAEDKAMGRLEG